jgi:hypothetical protein
MSQDPVPVVSPPELPAPQTLVCANCGAPLTGEYCAACGQRHEPHVHTLTHFAGEAFESITHADSRLWRTLGYLLAKPGRLTREFFDGRRARFLPPFRLYLVISLLFFLVTSLPDKFGGNNDHVNFEVGDQSKAGEIKALNEAAKTLAATPGAEQLSEMVRAQAAREKAAREKAALEGGGKPGKVEGLQDQNGFTEFCKAFAKPDPTANANYARMHEMCVKTADDHGKALLEAIFHNIPRAMFIFLPLVALVMKLLYWRPRRYYVEHLLFLVHNHACVFLAFAIVGLLERIPVVGGHLTLLNAAIWIYIIWYIFRAMRNYYQQSRGLTLAKYLTIGFAYLTTSISVLVLTAIYSALTL